LELVSLGIVSCEGHLNQSTKDLSAHDKADIPIIDTLVKPPSKSVISNSVIASETSQSIPIDSFLLKPFDV
jgi:hypothetical protein